MNKAAPQKFFVDANMAGLRRVSRKYPGVRGIYRTKSSARFMQIIELLTIVTRQSHLLRTAKNSWARAVTSNDCTGMIRVAEDILGVPAIMLPVGTQLPVLGVGFCVSPAVGKQTAGLLLDDMRVLKWCQGTAVPTFSVQQAQYDTILVHTMEL